MARFKVTFLPARKLTLDPALKGKARRQAAGLALQDILVDAAVETTPFDRTLFAALGEARDRRLSALLRSLEQARTDRTEA